MAKVPVKWIVHIVMRFSCANIDEGSKSVLPSTETGLNEESSRYIKKYVTLLTAKRACDKFNFLEHPPFWPK